MDELIKRMADAIAALPDDTHSEPASYEFRQWTTLILNEVLYPVSKEFVDEGKSIAPRIIVLREGSDHVIAIPIEDFSKIAHKERVAWAQRKIAQLPGVLACIFHTECWMRNYDKSDPDYEDGKQGKSIEHDPKRTEALIWNVMRGHMQLLAFADITRNPDKLGKLRLLDPHSEHSPMTGRMVLDPPRK